jgi:hypothetical protein
MFIFMFVFLAVRHVYIFVCKTDKTGKITVLLLSDYLTNMVISHNTNTINVNMSSDIKYFCIVFLLKKNWTTSANKTLALLESWVMSVQIKRYRQQILKTSLKQVS